MLRDNFPPEHSSPLLDAIRRDDQPVLKKLYIDCFHSVQVYILNNSGTEEEIKDIYQEAFVAVWRNIQLDRFVPDSEQAFSAYLFRVAKNKWIDELRKKKTRLSVLTGAELESQITDEEYADETDSYIDAVKEKYAYLGQRCRELLNRFYFMKQSLREIAEAFSWTEASAKNNKYRCLKQLRELIIKEEGGDE